MEHIMNKKDFFDPEEMQEFRKLVNDYCGDGKNIQTIGKTHNLPLKFASIEFRKTEED